MAPGNKGTTYYGTDDANKDYEKSLNAFIKSAQEKSEDKHLLFW